MDYLIEIWENLTYSRNEAQISHEALTRLYVDEFFLEFNVGNIHLCVVGRATIIAVITKVISIGRREVLRSRW